MLALPSIQRISKSEALRAIGTSSKARLDRSAGQSPTSSEQGLPNYVVEGWFAVIGQPSASRHASRAHCGVYHGVRLAEVKEPMGKQGTASRFPHWRPPAVSSAELD